MSKPTLGFIYASLFYLFLGATLGVGFFIVPEVRVLRVVHTHWNLVGFVTFMIFGVAYHVLPRFRGRPLYSERLAWWQFWLANIGLLGLTLFMALDTYLAPGPYRPLAGAFGAVLALSFYLFIYVMARTLLEPVKEH
ncbi:MAG TPA: cbb3-type cytochrome c oxidase subunit I [Dehalococcoidia bacterium]|nr:cbb3-type cytochrome c oxidase subunit I [Dehalococcoidia bacterium]